MAGFLWVSHPDVAVPGLVPQAAYDEVWGPKGWTPVDVDLDEASAALGGAVVDPAALPVEYVARLVADKRAAATEPEPPPEPAATPRRGAHRTKEA
jgi:hypothetical protein